MIVQSLYYITLYSVVVCYTNLLFYYHSNQTMLRETFATITVAYYVFIKYTPCQIQ